MTNRTDLLNQLETGAYWGAGVTFKRSNAVPLEKYSIFGSLADAQEYALNNGVAYPGQTLAVVTDSNEVTLYIVQAGATTAETSLAEVGKATLGDGKSIDLNGETLSVHDFGKCYFAYDNDKHQYSTEKTSGWKAGLEPKVRLVSDATGAYEIAWYEPNPTTVEGLSTSITALQQTVETMEGNYTTVTGNVTTLQGKVSTLEGQASNHDTDLADLKSNVYRKNEVYTQSETDEKISAAVAAQTHMTTKVVTEVDAVTQDNVIYLIKDTDATGTDVYLQYLRINGQAVCIGDTSTDLTGYATEDWVTGKGYAVAADVTESISGVQSNINKVDAKFASYTTTEDLNTLLGGYATDSELSAAVKTVDDKAVANAGKIADNETAISNLTTRIEAAEGNITANDGDINTINGKIDTINDEIADINTTIGNLNTEFATDSELAATKTEIEGKIADEVEALDEKINLKANSADVYTQDQTDTKISDAIAALDVTDTKVANKVVLAVSETDGKISVTRDSITASYISDFDTKVQAKVDAAVENEAEAREALATRVSAVETASATHATKSELAGVSSVANTASTNVTNLTQTVSELSQTHAADKAAIDESIAGINTKFNSYYTSSQVDTKLSDYAKTSDVNTTISSITTDIQGINDTIAALGDTYATDEELADAVETLQGSINGVEGALNNYVPKTRKVNGKSLDADITITLTELGGETPEGAQAKANAALAAAKSDAADKVSAATETITGAYQAADTTLSNRIKAIEDTYVKHSDEAIEYILDCGGAAAR